MPVLLVEGSDDKEVVLHLLKKAGLAEVKVTRPGDRDPAAKDEGGYASLRKNIPAYLTNLQQTLGIVVDADDNLDARWQSLRDAMSRAPVGAVQLPKQPQPNGTIVEDEENGRKVGVWVMPNNNLPGMLEDFVAFLIPQNDVLFTHAGQVVGEVSALASPPTRFKDIHRRKAEIHTWLAWCEEPGKPMGQAITKRFLDADCAQAAAFIGWLTRLYSS